jgi:PIN domain nuclease of toxin-antitoxin system
MRLLLDTHAFLFAINPWERLPQKAQREIADSAEVYVSAITLWEIAIKVGIGKLPLPANAAFYFSHVASLGAEMLAVTPEHASAVFGLPLHHRDPFDRLLIAQALAENLTIVSQDRAFAGYGVRTLWE